MTKSSPFLLLMALCVSLSACQGGPTTPSPEDPFTAQAGPSFGFGSGSPEAGNYTQILGTFSSQPGDKDLSRGRQRSSLIFPTAAAHTLRSAAQKEIP